MSDLISRQAAIDALWKALYEYEDKTEKQFIGSKELDVADWIQHRIFVQNMSDIDRQTILGLPSAQSTRQRGEWVEMGTNIDGTHNIKCSKCGEGYKTRGHARSILTQKKYRFCPHCGAKMNLEEDDDKSD